MNKLPLEQKQHAHKEVSSNEKLSQKSASGAEKENKTFIRCFD